MTAAIAAGRSFTLALLLFKQNTPLIQPFAGACRRRGGRRAEVKEPQDTAVDRSVRLQKTVMLNEPNSKASKAFENITNVIINGDETIAAPKKSLAQIFSGLLNRK